MGHRGRIVIEQNGIRAFHYVKGANLFHEPLVLGPEGLKQLVSQDPEDIWVEAITYFEGGVYANYDLQELLWFGGEDDLYHFQSRQDLLALMTPAWDGWDIAWAHNGLHDIARRCDLSLPEDGGPAASDWSAEMWSQMLGEVVPGLANPNDTYFNSDFLVSIRDGDDVHSLVGHHPSIRWGDDIIGVPPQMLAELDGLSNSLHLTAAPNQGVHVDLRTKKVHFWAGFFHRAPVRSAENGWVREHLNTEFRGHLALASPAVTSSHQDQAVDHLVRRARTLVRRNEFVARDYAWRRGEEEPQHHDWQFEPGELRIRLAMSLQSASGNKLGVDDSYELLDPAHVLPDVLEHLARRHPDHPAADHD